MNIILTILVGFPMGYLIRSRSTAVLTYVLVDSYLFTFQTAFLLMQWVDGDDHAFGARGGDWTAERTTWSAPTWSSTGSSSPSASALVLGHRLRARRSARRDVVAAG